MKKSAHELAWILILMIPIFLYYFFHFLPIGSNIGTGFIHGDLLSYMSNARQYYDNEGFSLFYSNPFQLDNQGTRIYFQFQTLLLAVLWKITQADVGLLFVAFGMLSTFFALWISLRFYKTYLGWNSMAHKLTFILFIFGGGLLLVAGYAFSVVEKGDFYQAIFETFRFDPGGGFWMLNFGRNFIYPLEAYYHLISMAILFAVLRKKHLLSSILLFVIAFSHPFYGIQFLLILIAYQLIEVVVIKEHQNNLIKALVFNVFTLALFAFYNLGWLSSFDSHAILIKQWSLNWSFDVLSQLLAYGLLASLFVYSIRNTQSFKTFFADSFHRFLLVYFLISLLLANHDLFIKPIQPLHFTHGHIYIPLFLMTAPWLISFFKKSMDIRFQWLQILLFLLLISDNLLWFPAQYYNNATRLAYVAVRETPDQKSVLKFINQHFDSNYLLISSDLDYLATAYTSVYTLLPHPYNTPFVADRLRLRDEVWKNQHWHLLPLQKLIFAVNKSEVDMINALQSDGFTPIFQNTTYLVFVKH